MHFSQIVGRPAGDLKISLALICQQRLMRPLQWLNAVDLRLLKDTKAYRASRFALSSAFGPFMPSVSLGQNLPTLIIIVCMRSKILAF